MRLFAPEWVKQHLTWPSELERRVHAGRSTFEDRLIAVGWIDEIMSPRIPRELTDQLVELSRWMVLYDDWSRNVGADAFLVRFTTSGFVVHIAEVPSAAVILARPLDASYFDHSAGPVSYALEVATILFDQGLLPVRRDLVLSEPLELLAGAHKGHWTANGRGLSRRGYEEEALRKHPIEFFVQGDLCGFLIQKGMWRDGGQTLFQRRFEEPDRDLAGDDVVGMLDRQMIRDPSLQDPGDRVAYYENLRRHLGIRTVEEFLGPMLFDREGRRLTVEHLDHSMLEATIERLNAEQRSILLRQRRVDWLYVEGLKSFEKGDLEGAIESWSRAVIADPSNVRIVVMLDIASRMHLDREYSGDWRRANDDMLLHQVNQLISYHNSRIREVARSMEEEERKLERIATLRAEGINLYKLQEFAASRAKWEEILTVDDRNATAQLYINLCDMKMEELRGGVAAAAPVEMPGAPGRR
jgi:hypothetical protein